MDVSIVVPLYNEDESLPELCAWIERVVTENGLSYEVILIDDGSTDDSWNVIEKLIEENGHIKGIKFQRNYGKSAALNEGFKATQGEVVITMDADMQDSPDEIPGLRNMIVDENFDLVTALSGREALEKSEDRDVDLLVTDFHMPTMKGPELADELRKRLPGLKVLYQTGFSEQLFEERLELAEGEAFLEKPFTATGLREAARLILYGRINP